MQRPTAEKRHYDQRAIERKKNFLKNCYGKHDWFEDWTNGGQRNRLNKGKIFCSCPMCSNKTKYQGTSISDYRKIEKMQSSLEESGFDLKILPVKGWW